MDCTDLGVNSAQQCCPLLRTDRYFKPVKPDSLAVEPSMRLAL